MVLTVGAETSTSAANDYWSGFKFHANADGLTVTALGLYRFPGNSETHTVRLFAGDGETVLAERTVDLSSVAEGEFAYVDLDTPLALPNAEYYLAAQYAVGTLDLVFNDCPVTVVPEIDMVKAFIGAPPTWYEGSADAATGGPNMKLG